MPGRTPADFLPRRGRAPPDAAAASAQAATPAAQLAGAPSAGFYDIAEDASLSASLETWQAELSSLLAGNRLKYHVTPMPKAGPSRGVYGRMVAERMNRMSAAVLSATDARRRSLGLASTFTPATKFKVPMGTPRIKLGRAKTRGRGRNLWHVKGDEAESAETVTLHA